jgi:transcription termination/antitermination protein NusA
MPAHIETIANPPRPQWSDMIEARLDAKRLELGVDDGLKQVLGVTTSMLVVFGENGIKRVEDLAACATDELTGWYETDKGRRRKHPGILDRLKVARKDCDKMILDARFKVGWI